MGFVEAVVFGREENGPCPEIFVAVVTVESWFYWITFAHVNRGKRTVIAWADQNIDARSQELGAIGDAFVVAAIEDNSDTSPE